MLSVLEGVGAFCSVGCVINLNVGTAAFRAGKTRERGRNFLPASYPGHLRRPERPDKAIFALRAEKIQSWDIR